MKSKKLKQVQSNIFQILFDPFLIPEDLESEMFDWPVGRLAGRHGRHRSIFSVLSLVTSCQSVLASSPTAQPVTFAPSLPKNDITADVPPLGRRLNSWTNPHSLEFSWCNRNPQEPRRIGCLSCVVHRPVFSSKPLIVLKTRWLH